MNLKLSTKFLIIFLAIFIGSFYVLPAQASVLPYPRKANFFLKWEISDSEARELSKWDLLILDMEVQARQPETIGLFLSSWDGLIAPSQASAAGGLFADDDALGAWQDRNGDPAGMPVPAMFFDMAAIELGQQVGAALEGLLNHLPDFD